jgi:4-amino-4-deoxy-L-arabinose transferase-like glycosyltransferase
MEQHTPTGFSFRSINNSARIRRSDLLVLTLAAAVLFGVMLGSRPYSVPDEGRYVEIPREMVVTGDWLTPRLNGVKYFEKPPLFYWIEAVLIRLFGLSEWVTRTVPAIFALLGCLAVWYAGTLLFGRVAGILSAVVLATSMIYYALSRLITPDMPVTVLLTVALLSFLLGTQEHGREARRMFFLSFYTFAALAVLAKGLIGIVLPGIIICCWMLVSGEWRVLKSLHLISGAGIFLLIVVPWHLFVGHANPEFFGFYFVREHFKRYLTTVHHHFKPVWFFIPVLLGGMLPWTAFLLQAIRHNLPARWSERKQHPHAVFLLLWAVIIFLFFSASSSKLIPYILPAVPPLALLIGRYLADAWEGNTLKGFGAGLTALGVLAAALIAMLLAFLSGRLEFVPQVFVPYGAALTAVLVAGILVTWFLVRWDGRRGVIIAITGSTALFLLLSGSAAPVFDKRTIKPLALTLKPLLDSNDEIVAYRTYYQDLPVYLERTITIADWRGELEFGSKQEDVSRWMIDDQECWKRWEGPNRVFLVTSKDNFHNLLKNSGRTFHVVDETRLDLLLSNERVHQ